MLDNLFLSVLNMSLVASYVITFVLLARLVLKKAPKIFSYALWGVVLLRLLCPLSFESALSLIPVDKQPIPQDIIYSQVPKISKGMVAVDNIINPVLPIPTDIGASINPIQVWLFIGEIVWILGIIVMAIYSVISYTKLKRSLATSIPLIDNIYLADHISTPFVLGMIRPKIYLPSSLLENEQGYIIRHELCHIRRLDHITRMFGFLALSVHWFNPLVWIAFVLSGKDMELSCDEAVMKSMDTDIKAEYSQSLLRFSTTKKIIHVTPLAFGEGDTKNRVKNVLNYKKPKFWVVLITALLCLVVVFCLASNPSGTTIQNPYIQEYVVGATGILGSVNTQEYTEISKDFAIGADNYGRAVFKDPHKAFATFETFYIDAIELIKLENDLKPFSHKNYEMYKVYGIQMGYKEGDPEMLARCVFVSRFLDIYENSFDKTVPNTSYVEPTVEVKDVEGSFKPLTLDQAVIKALSDTSNRYLGDECFGEGHIILGTEKDGDTTKVYTLTMVGYYGFVNNNFEKASGSGIIPAVVTLKNNNEVTIEYPKDGSDYASSIKEMFPLKYHSRIFGDNDSDRKNLKEQEQTYAKEYLSKIGRNADIGDYGDFEHTTLTKAGVSIEVSNKLEDFFKMHSYYPYFIGTKEIIEDGVRMVYEMSYQERQQEITFKKYLYDSKKLVEQFVFNSITGEKIAQ